MAPAALQMTPKPNDCLSKAHHPYTAENQILFDESPKCSMTNFDWSGVSQRAAVVLLF
jgi:hypothetical protein